LTSDHLQAKPMRLILLSVNIDKYSYKVMENKTYA
jgi:hypothetical protein